MSIVKTIDNLDLDQVAESGQCFRWKKIDENTYNIPAFGKILTISRHEKAEHDFILDCKEEEWKAVWRAYFDLDTDYEAIAKLISESDDEYLKEAYEAGSGIRILKQDLWEVIVSFLISQNNNIKRIKASIDALCKRAGLEMSAFPGPEDIGPDFDFSGLGLGYRDVYLKDVYSFARSNPNWPECLKGASYEEAAKDLKSHPGIGPKVADCVCLFGLHHVEAFPIDTHVKSILKEHYPGGFDFNKYKGVAGILQQYMFNYELQSKTKKVPV